MGPATRLLLVLLLGGCSLPSSLSCPPGDGLGAWTALATPGQPSHRYAHVVEAVPGGALVFGGIVDGEASAEGRRWYAAEDRWEPLATDGAPSPRAEAAHAVVFLPDGSARVVIFGGQAAGLGAPGADQVLADGAVWNPATGAWLALPPGQDAPPGRYRASLAGHPTLPRAYLVGGRDASGPRDDAWELDLGVTPPRWTALQGGFPLRGPSDSRPFMAPPLLLAAVPAHGAWHVTLAAVGPHGTTDDDGTRMRAAFLRLPGGSWVTDDAQGAPPARDGASMAWASALPAILVHGGHDPHGDPGDDPARYLDDTWAYVPPSPDPAAPTDPARYAAGTHAFRSACAPQDGGTAGRCGAADVSVPRAFHGAAWTGDGLLVAGGLDPGSCGGGAFLDLAEGRWTRAAFLGSPARERLPGLAWIDGVGALFVGGHRPSSLVQVPPRAVRWAP